MTKNESSPMIWVLAGIDLSLLFLNVFPTGNEGVDGLFALDLESNFVVWYSSAKLLVASALCWQVSQHVLGSRWPLRVTAFSLLAISISETAMIHERLYGAIHTLTTGREIVGGGRGIWVLYFAPVILAVAIILVIAALRTGKQFPRAKIPLFCAIMLWVIVLVAETAPRWAAPLDEVQMFVFVLVEESCELFGTTAMIIGMYAARQSALGIPTTRN